MLYRKANKIEIGNKTEPSNRSNYVAPPSRNVVQSLDVGKIIAPGKTISRGMRLAPRKTSMIGATMASFRKVFGGDKVYIFAEPGDYDLKGIDNVVLIKNNTTLGDAKNYRNALEYLYNKTTSDYICVLEDDWIFNKDAKAIISEAIGKLKNSFGYLSLRTDGCSGHYINKPGWNDVSVSGYQRVGRGLTGNLFLYPRSVVGDMLKNPYYINHCNTYKRGNASDCQVAETIKLMGLKTLYHNPSLAIHIGTDSTLGHDKNNKNVDANPALFWHKDDIPERKIVGIATIPERAELLKKTITSIYDQVDEINLGLNNYKEVPEYIMNLKKIRPILLDNSTGDAAKYFYVHEAHGYYFTIDDDIEYPSDYVEKMIAWIDLIGKDKCAIGCHGHSFKKFRGAIDIHKDVDHYYYFTDLIKNDPTKVHILGTGVSAFHTSALHLHYQDFKEPNKADEQFAVISKIQGVGLYVAPHLGNWIVNLDKSEQTPALRKQTTWKDRIMRYQKNLFALYGDVK